MDIFTSLLITVAQVFSCEPGVAHSAGMALSWDASDTATSYTVYVRPLDEGQLDWTSYVITRDRNRKKGDHRKYGGVDHYWQLLGYHYALPTYLHEVGVTASNSAGESGMSETILVCWPFSTEYP